MDDLVTMIVTMLTAYRLNHNQINTVLLLSYNSANDLVDPIRAMDEAKDFMDKFKKADK